MVLFAKEQKYLDRICWDIEGSSWTRYKKSWDIWLISKGRQKKTMNNFTIYKRYEEEDRKSCYPHWEWCQLCYRGDKIYTRKK